MISCREESPGWTTCCEKTHPSVLKIWLLPKDCYRPRLKSEFLCRESPVFKGGLGWCTSKSHPMRESGCRWGTHPNLGTGKCSQVQEYQEPQWAWWGCGCAQWEGGMWITQTRHWIHKWYQWFQLCINTKMEISVLMYTLMGRRDKIAQGCIKKVQGLKSWMKLPLKVLYYLFHGRC